MDDSHILLAVLAHPDDESFGMGGTLALYAARGVQVHLICATRGEVGMVDENDMNGYHSIAELREAELRCAASKLGLAGVHFLNYRDSGMPGTPENKHPDCLVAAPMEQVVSQLVEYIRKLCPQVVLTFDPIGGYRHPDHIAIHNATVQAFKEASNPNYPSPLPPFQPDKLYFHTMPRGLLKMAVRILPLFGKDPKHWGRNGDIDLTELSAEEFPVHAKINYGPVRERKVEASLCHSSQGGKAMAKGLMGWVLRMGGATETFMRAYPAPVDGHRERDLFEGVG